MEQHLPASSDHSRMRVFCGTGREPHLCGLALTCSFGNSLNHVQWQSPSECLFPVKCYLQSSISNELSVLWRQREEINTKPDRWSSCCISLGCYFHPFLFILFYFLTYSYNYSTYNFFHIYQLVGSFMCPPG